MTQENKQKVNADNEYSPNDPALQRDKKRAQTLIKIYNETSPEEKEKRNTILKLLLKTIGRNSEITSPFYCDYGYNTTIGANFYSNFNCVISDKALVTIGDNVTFGPNVQIYTTLQPTDPRKRKQRLELAKPVTIEDDVWIGGGTVITAGVTIGHATTIEAGSVVTDNIPPNVIASGNPCRITRKIMD